MVLSWSNPHGFLSLHNHLLSLNTSYYRFLHLIFALRSIKCRTATKMYISAFLRLLHPNTRGGLNNDTATNVRACSKLQFQAQRRKNRIQKHGCFTAVLRTRNHQSHWSTIVHTHTSKHALTMNIPYREARETDSKCMYGHLAADWINSIKNYRTEMVRICSVSCCVCPTAKSWHRSLWSG